LSDSALALVATQSWPGNVRQLKNFIERVLVLSSTDAISDDDIRRELQREVDLRGPSVSESTSEGLSARRAEVEKAALIEALEKSNDNRTVAARILGISRRTLSNKLAEHGRDAK
jgi:two-component system response regulator AtoC